MGHISEEPGRTGVKPYPPGIDPTTPTPFIAFAFALDGVNAVAGHGSLMS